MGEISDRFFVHKAEVIDYCKHFDRGELIDLLAEQYQLEQDDRDLTDEQARAELAHAPDETFQALFRRAWDYEYRFRDAHEEAIEDGTSNVSGSVTRLVPSTQAIPMGMVEAGTEALHLIDGYFNSGCESLDDLDRARDLLRRVFAPAS